MFPLARFLILLGVTLVVVGLIVQFGGRFLPFGRLPGDVVLQKGNVKVYFPVVTCLLVSVVLTLLFSLFRFFGK